MRRGKRVADRIRAEGAARRLEEGVGKSGGALGVVDHRPGDDDVLRRCLTPLDVGHGDALLEALGDRVKHLGMGDGRGVPFPLETDLGGVDRTRGVGQQHELEIDAVGSDRGGVAFP
jgi:hypothetical protein